MSNPQHILCNRDDECVQSKESRCYKLEPYLQGRCYQEGKVCSEDLDCFSDIHTQGFSCVKPKGKMGICAPAQQGCFTTQDCFTPLRCTSYGQCVTPYTLGNEKELATMA
ncbi:hypothetical protein DdX_13881 [Ditylenchus destructor]|uniref:Uncharacterized protein n=1 Tax=Ditylenchus destructor TaxID=166010 RepID=A0AAD4MVF3_9BILA|nr:hypothetical protein DdX_13881 [Ditylenchus destructor]